MYKIMGKYRNSTEEVDSAETMQEANYLRQEYQMAYGAEWRVWIVTDGEPSHVD